MMQSQMVLIPQVCPAQAHNEKLSCVFSCRLPSFYSPVKQGTLPEQGRGFYPAIRLVPDQAWNDVLLLEFTSSLVMFREDTPC